MTEVYQVKDRQFRQITKRCWETRRLIGARWGRWRNSSFVVTRLNDDEVRTYFGIARKVDD